MPDVPANGIRSSASGVPSLSADTLSFDVAHTLDHVHVLWECTVQRRTILRSGAGVHCLQGTLKRLEKANASGGAVSFTGISAASANKGLPLAAGVTYFYAAEYRNAEMNTAPGCNVFYGFNWTNAGSVAWRTGASGRKWNAAVW